MNYCLVFSDYSVILCIVDFRIVVSRNPLGALLMNAPQPQVRPEDLSLFDYMGDRHAICISPTVFQLQGHLHTDPNDSRKTIPGTLLTLAVNNRLVEVLTSLALPHMKVGDLIAALSAGPSVLSS